MHKSQYKFLSIVTFILELQKHVCIKFWEN